MPLKLHLAQLTDEACASGAAIMAGKNTAVFGIYPTKEQTERAVDILMRAGFASGDISALLPDRSSTKAFAHEKDTKAPEGTTTGVTAGGVIGGTLGILAGIGSIAIPGLGPFIAAGPIMAGLAGLGVGGAVGGIVGALVGMGIPEYEAKRYEGQVKEGGNLVSVHCETSDEIRRAKDLLRSTGARDISSTSEESSGSGARRERASDVGDDLRATDTRASRAGVGDTEPRVGDATLSDPDRTTTGLGRESIDRTDPKSDRI
jgi:hypothetical protein